MIGSLLIRLVTSAFTGATGLIGLGPVLAILFGAAATGAVGLYIKGRMDCAASYELAAANQTIKHLKEQIDALQQAAKQAEQMADEHAQAEAENDALTSEIVGNPDDGDGCAGPGFLHRLSRLK